MDACFVCSFALCQAGPKSEKQRAAGACSVCVARGLGDGLCCSYVGRALDEREAGVMHGASRLLVTGC